MLYCLNILKNFSCRPKNEPTGNDKPDKTKILFVYWFTLKTDKYNPALINHLTATNCLQKDWSDSRAALAKLFYRTFPNYFPETGRSAALMPHSFDGVLPM